MIRDKSTLDRILESATVLFLERGYEGVGLREIAARSDVTTGAFYRHFKGKRELFSSLVGEVYDTLIEIYRSTLSSFFLLPASEQLSSMHDHTIEASDRMIRYMYQHMTETRLILCCSQGTEYSDRAKTLATMDETATADFTTGSINAGINVNIVHRDLEVLLTEGMFSAVLELVKKEMPIDEMLQCAHSLIDFYEAGWSKLMGL